MKYEVKKNNGNLKFLDNPILTEHLTSIWGAS